jgi:PRTRC genetic system ThiF family protein
MTTRTGTSATHEHKLATHLLSQRINVLVIGCGGTGSAIASGLVFLHQALLAFGHPHGLHVTLVDGDRISRTNCVRQPFSENEIGLYKADVLATRINLFWGLDWTSDSRFVDRRWHAGHNTHIVISCVDSRKARRAVTETGAYQQAVYWLDLGNNADSGQFVLGQPDSCSVQKGDTRLANVANLFPEIIDPNLDAKDKLPSCSALQALENQSPFVNQALANLSLAMLAQLFRYGRLRYHGGFVNLTTGRMTPLLVDPTAWKRLSESRQLQRRKRSRSPNTVRNKG